VPFNIASYALLTHMLAQVCGYEVGTFIHNFGDVHVYLNHTDQLQEQLTREPKPLPALVLNSQVDAIDKFTYADITLKGYDPHPAIKAEVSV
jgi:thymidylate synthase